ncbi:MAG: undecaprenyl-diphosphate phosphatase [Verrucomicrobia bacterium]|nr:undecaprenyl-diphosphate phosphatase [Verrucomicrobiota bacterium]MBI3870338.1 undecaprenyl-diphosphate phosphatase [Verrucomicrobiota bacterium]
MPDWLAVILLGIIEGLTEFLPVSSTGHLLLAEQWLNISKTELFNTVIQCGALMAVLAVFWSRVNSLALGWREANAQKYLIHLAVAFGITGVGGLLLKKVLHWKLPHTPFPVAIATLAGGFVILAIERWVKGRPGIAEITIRTAVIVGFAQLLAAAFPGTSRSGACILFALLAGTARPAATEFSFLVGIPTMIAASGLEIVSSLKSGERIPGSDWGMVALGSAAAAVTAFLVVRWLLRFVQTHTFVAFGWYRIALGAVILWLARGH